MSNDCLLLSYHSQYLLYICFNRCKTEIMSEILKIYDIPDVENHSFFYYLLSVEWKEQLPMHQHDAWEVMYIISGRGTRVIGDTIEPFEAGEVVLIPPSIPHDWKFDSTTAKVEHALVSFTQNFLLKCIALFPELGNIMKDVKYPTHALRLYNPENIRQTLLNMNEKSDYQRLLMLLQLIPEIFLHSSSVCVGSPFKFDKDSERMKLIYGYIMRSYHKRITLDDIAKELNMGRSSFCVFFKRCCGISFLTFLNKYRIDRACNLLIHSKLDISEICFSVGFNDVLHFNRVFKSIKGKTPREYRRQTP